MAKRKAKKRKNLVLRGDVWWFRKRIGGKVYRVTTGCKDPNQAARRAVEIEKDINDGRFGWKPKPPAPTVSEWADAVLRTYVLPNQERAGRRACGGLYVRTLERLKTCATLALLPLDQVVEQHCITHLTTAYPNTANNTLRTIHGLCKAVWNRARRNKLVVDNPWCFTMRKRVLRKRVLLMDEQPRLLAMLSPQYQRFVKVLLLTGLRNSELCELKQDAVDFVRRTITVFGKGEKYRTVPLTPECADLLREQMRARDNDELGHLMPTQRRAVEAHCIFPICRNSAERRITTAAKAAKLSTRLTVHDMQRTFATRCAMSGVPMKKLQEWLGHASINLTADFYTQNLAGGEDDLLAAVRACIVDGERTEANTKVVTLP